jgi:YihY family inner membrane protein
LAVLFVSFVGLLGAGQEIINYVEERVFPLVAPEFKQTLSDWLHRYISPTAFREGPTGIINIAAIVGLIMGALNILLISERVFNHIWKFHEKQNYIQKLTIFWVILTTSPFMILASMWLESFLVPEGGFIQRLLQEHWILGAFYRAGIPFFVGFIGFSLLYLFLPSAQVQIKSAAVAGLMATILWYISKRGFYFYVLHAGAITNFYKHLATVPLFFIWLYVTWLIILWGAQLSYAFQNYEFLSNLRKREIGNRKYSLAFLGIYTLSRAHASFRGKAPPPGQEEIADELGIQENTVKHLVNLFVDMGILMEDARSPGHFILAKDPRQIVLSQIIQSLHAEQFPGEARKALLPAFHTSVPPQSSSSNCVEDLFSKAYQAFFNALGTETLDSAFVTTGDS